MGNKLAQVTDPLDEKEVESAQHHFDNLVKDYGWDKKAIFSRMSRQIMKQGSKDTVIQAYDNFIQQNILGEQNVRTSMPTGVYNHYLKLFNNAIEESLDQTSYPARVYKDDFEFNKRSHDGVYEWILIAYNNIRSGVERTDDGLKYYLRVRFQVAIFTKLDQEARDKLMRIMQEQQQRQQQLASLFEK